MKNLILILGAAFSLFLSSQSLALEAITPNRLADPNLIVGTFYFPGWNKSEAAEGNGAHSPWAWDSVQHYPDRKPLQGYYNEGSWTEGPAVARRQIKQASEHGINLFIFNWYRKNTPENPRSVEPARA